MNRSPVAAAFFLLTMAFIAVGCGQSVRHLSIHDNRLPLDARRWIADADDAVTVTGAWRDEAREKVQMTLEWQQGSVRGISWPALPEAAAAQSALADLARARITLARMELELAEAEHALAEIRREQVNAETAVRYDLRYYDLEPLLEATRTARTNVERTARRVAEQRVASEEATTEWWHAYQRYIAAGGDPRVLWLEER